MERLMVQTHSCKYFTSNVEYISGMCFLHCDVHINTPNAIRAVKMELSRLLEEHYNKGYDFIYAYIVNERFALMMGGEKINSFFSEGSHFGVFRYATSSTSSNSCSGGCCNSILNSTGAAGQESSFSSAGSL